jgi:hypothetical protein
MVEFLNSCSRMFTKSVWGQAKMLLLGAILAPGKRTVSAVLRVMGLGSEGRFQNYHRVLSRAQWSALKGSQLLLRLLIELFVPIGVVVLGLDDTIERRKGTKIKAKGIYRDPVRSSHSHFVKTSGLRWLSLMLLAEIPWAGRVWALPFLTALAPSERFAEEQGRRHKKLTDWARQMLLQVRRWLPERELVVVTDSNYAVIQLLWELGQLGNPITMITRLRLDAALYQPAPQRHPHQPNPKGRPRLKGQRLPTLAKQLDDTQTTWTWTTLKINRWYGEGERTVEVASDTAIWYHSGMPPLAIRWVLIRDPKGKFKPQALLSTNLNLEPQQILSWFVQRWQLEVTFEEVPAHLGVETQRQWSDLAIARTTPILLGLFSIVTLLAHQISFCSPSPAERTPKQSAWYVKALPTFSDALAAVRSSLWQQAIFPTSRPNTDLVNVPRDVLLRLTDLLCYAA